MQAGRDWEEFQWDTYARLQSLGLYKPRNNCPTCLKWVFYWLFDSLDEKDAKDKITCNSSYTPGNLKLDLIAKKLREEEDKKNVKDGRKTNTNSSNKSSKPVIAVAKNTTKNGSSGESYSGSSSDNIPSAFSSLFSCGNFSNS